MSKKTNRDWQLEACERCVKNKARTTDTGEALCGSCLEHKKDVQDIKINKLQDTPDNTIIDSTEHDLNIYFLGKQIASVIATLRENEKIVLEHRFGLKTGQPKTLEEVGIIIGVTRERVRQIQERALRRLRHPSRGMKLKPFLYE